MNNQMHTPLPTTFRARGFDWEILERTGDVALLLQKFKGTDGNHVVAVIQKQDATEFRGKRYEAKEALPTWEQWGSKAWTFMSKDAAEAKFSKVAEAQEKKDAAQLLVA